MPPSDNVEELAECTFALPLATMVDRFNCEIALLQAKCCVADAHTALIKKHHSTADNLLNQGQEWVLTAKRGNIAQMELPISQMVKSLEDAAIQCQAQKTHGSGEFANSPVKVSESGVGNTARAHSTARARPQGTKMRIIHFLKKFR